MLLISAPLECSAIKTITNDPKLADLLLPRLDEKHFGFEPAQTMFKRILTLARQKAAIPHWDQLMVDLILPEDVREAVKTQEDSKIYTSKKQATRALDALESHRRARTLHKMATDIGRSLKGDSLDLDKISEHAADQLVKSRMRTDIEQQMLHIGGDYDNSKFIRHVLSGNALDMLPTGFRAFDDRNQGIARGSVFVLAATSGGGKSVMALKIAMYQALLGLRTCLISLEMEREQNLMRMFAQLARINHSRIIDPKNLTSEEKERILEAYDKFDRRVRKNGGVFTTISPEDDLTVEDALMVVKPYDYDNNVLDYLTLFSGLDGELGWQKIGNAIRYSKRYAAANKNVVTALAQLGDDGDIRYSKAIREHAANMWTWQYREQEVRDSHIISIKQQKARMQQAFDFTLQEQFEYMDIVDTSTQIPARTERKQEKNGKGKKSGKSTSDDSAVFTM